MTPQVVAHRGASHDNAEHTLGAYVRALEAGADGLECDVRLTSDGHLVCVHDRTLRRTASTRGTVSTMDLAALSELDFGAWKNPWSDLDDEAPDRDVSMEGLLTLRALLETVASYDRRIEVAIETKHPTRFGGKVEKRLVELLREFGWDQPGSPVRVMSFSWIALRRVVRRAPDVQLVQLVEKQHHWPLLRRIIGKDWIVGPGMQELHAHPRLGRAVARSGHDIHVWVVNTEADLKVCMDLGVKAVITDRPAHIRKLLSRT